MLLMSLEEEQVRLRQQLKDKGKERQSRNRGKIDKSTLFIMYSMQNMTISEIAEKTNRTRQRIWQLLKEYKIHDVNHKRTRSTCLFCAKPLIIQNSKIRGIGTYCNDTCYHDHRRDMGAFIESRHGKRIARRKIEEWLGFPLPYKCVVHHEDGNESNNDLKNLFVFPSHAEHLRYHHAKRHKAARLPYESIHDLPGMIERWTRD